jgi:hypothetical protein
MLIDAVCDCAGGDDGKAAREAAVAAAAAARNDSAGAASGAGGSGAITPYDVPIVLLIVEAPSGKQVKVETTPVDCVLDVRQFLMDCPETCELTAYHLEHDSVVLNDYVELSEYPQLYDPAMRSASGSALGGMSVAGVSGLPPPAVLKICPDFYDERAARIHVRRCVNRTLCSAMLCAVQSDDQRAGSLTVLSVSCAVLCRALCAVSSDCVRFW